MTPVATHHIVGLQDLSSGAAVLDDGDARAAGVLLDRLRRPADAALDVPKFRHPRPQDTFGLVLGQPFVVLKVVGIDDLPQRRRVPVLAGQVAVGDDSVHRVFGRQDARRPQLVGDAPEIEVLHRALRQILPLRNPLRLDAAFHQGARYSAQPEVDRQCHADWASAHDDDLVPFGHSFYLVGSVPNLKFAQSRRDPRELRNRHSSPCMGRSAALHDISPIERICAERTRPARRHAPDHSGLIPARLDDRPPLFDPGPVQGGERLRRLLLAREDLLAEIDEPRAHRGIGQGIHDRRIEPGDDGRRRALGGKKPLPVLDVEPGQAGLVDRRDVGRRRQAASWP